MPMIYMMQRTTGGMPEMVFEYILKQHKIDPEKDLTINQNIDFGSTAAAFSEGQADFTVELQFLLHLFSFYFYSTPDSFQAVGNF